MNMLLAVDGPTLAQTPLNPLLWAVIGVLVSMLITLCVVVINIVKSRFTAIEQGLGKFQEELLAIKNDIKDLQHGQEMFSKDLKIKDMQMETIRLKNKLHIDE